MASTYLRVYCEGGTERTLLFTMLRGSFEPIGALTELRVVNNRNSTRAFTVLEKCLDERRNSEPPTLSWKTPPWAEFLLRRQGKSRNSRCVHDGRTKVELWRDGHV
jgi:hypothetical protein